MRIFLLFAIAAAIVWTAVCSPYQCQRVYDPSSYKGLTRVPTSCSPERIDCPASWKSGIVEGHSKALPLIDTNFIQCHEGFFCCGYVPIDNTTGEVLGRSGITVGSGVNLGTNRDFSLVTLAASEELTNQLQPYSGLSGDNAACAAIELPLVMNCSDAQQLTEIVMNNTAIQVQMRYDQERANDTKKYSALPRGIRTAVTDVWFQLGPPAEYLRFWDSVTKNDWENAIKELRDFYPKPESESTRDLRRRNSEADILEAALFLCNRSADIVFLVDESGSVNETDFLESLAFIMDIIDAFPEEELAGERGTKFGLSLFDDNYRSEFNLSSHTSKGFTNYTNSSANGYFDALSVVSQGKGGSYLGNAMRKVLLDQFNEARGMRPESYGLLRVLIVMTDGVSGDNVTESAAHIRASNIVIYAIGISYYDVSQLKAVASSQNHIKLLETFSDLGDFAATLTAIACHEPQPVTLGVKIEGSIKNNDFQYFTFDIPGNVNLKAEVMDLTGNTLVYASRTNPHPYKYDSDFGFLSASLATKIIVISPKSSSQRDDSMNPIYVSITGHGDNATYTLIGSACNSTECNEGTNESNGRAVVANMPLEAAALIVAVAILLS